jgi:hypothetical protein
MDRYAQAEAGRQGMFRAADGSLTAGSISVLKGNVL